MAKSTKKKIEEVIEETSIIEVPETVEEVAEEIVVEETPKEVEAEIPKPIAIKSTPIAEVKEELSMEERLLKFLDGKEGEIKINDFLKSLYPIARFNEPQQYLTQQASKTIKLMLNNLNLTVVNNQHEKLGKFYYEGENTETKYHNISTINISVKK